MAQSTQTYKRSLSGSVGAGMGSLFNGGGKTYYVLEHKVSSKYHRAGEAQEIIVDQVELGRDPKCAVQFDESFKTVSRRHAAIVRDGQNWKLIQLSQTNTTFLNGRPIQKEWYLQNGDEIQLSVNGPKLGFIIPTGNKATVGSIGLSRRLSLFRQQALRPYKTAMWALSVLLILAIGGGTWYGVKANKKIVEMGKASIEQREQAKSDLEAEVAARKALESELSKTKKQMQALDKQLKNINSTPSVNTVAPNVSGNATSNKSIATCEPNVYYIRIKVEASYDGQTRTIEAGSGSGFLLEDGRFITARHVVEPWMYPSSEEDENALILNAIAHNGGRVTCYLDAYSPTGKHLSFTSNNAVVNSTSDKSFDWKGATILIPENGALDWAYFRTNNTGGLTYNNTLSHTLPVQAKLTVLGYPMGIGANSPTDIHPIYSEAVVAREGLEHGYILTTATTFEHGNSGGPVFATSTDGKLIVVGLVSAGTGRSTGMVVPIASVK